MRSAAPFLSTAMTTSFSHLKSPWPELGYARNSLLCEEYCIADMLQLCSMNNPRAPSEGGYDIGQDKASLCSL